jgi:hypothetical protein
MGGMTIDLREPSFKEGVLATEKGGVVTGANFRIQARSISYTKKFEDGQEVSAIVAEGNLLIEFGNYVFVGDRLEFDLLTSTGIIFNGRTMVEPWFFGGETIYLMSDGTYYFDQAFVTTSENVNSNWEILADSATLLPEDDNERLLIAKNVTFNIYGLPVFWLPTFKANLNTIFDGPIRYSVKWGGAQGHRFGLAYEVFSWSRFKAFLRLDYRINRGLGGGVETLYRSEDHLTNFQTINYVARDSSIIHPSERLRYRFQGIGDTVNEDGNLSLHLSYDKLSDIDMATDYDDRGLDLETAGRTELVIRRQEDNYISNFLTRLKINKFQTIKQELPTFETSWRPSLLADTGIIADTQMKASYLDFAYGNNMVHVHDYNSTRLELTPILYRPFSFGFINAMPEAGGVLLAYGNSPSGSAEWLTLAKLGCTLNTHFTRFDGNTKHVITPYVQYSYYSQPTVSPNDHYIFDIEDGWYRLDMVQFGIKQSLFEKNCYGITRRVYANFWANAFIDTKTFPSTIPKVYGDLIFNPYSTLSHSINAAWDFNNNIIDHFNIRTDWTVSEDVAIAMEYRHRSSYDFRKVDHTNFILDSYRSIRELEHSQVSDRRDTFLLHFFYRFHPSWAFEFESRSGWNRKFQPNYNEFEIDLLGTLPSAWNMKLSYQHKEDDDRVSLYMSIGMKRPDCVKERSITPCPSF